VGGEPRPLPEALLHGLVRLDDALLVDRYRQALEAAGAPATALRHFHVDAAGYSPEVAEELGDPFYLGRHALHAHAVLVSPAQLDAPLVHPSLGFAGDALRAITAKARREVTAITLHEPLLVEVEHAAGRLVGPGELADASHFEIQLRTPGGHVRGSRRLEEMKREFLESRRLWLDDDYIQEMAELAAHVRDLGSIPEELAVSRHALGRLPFYTPAFGGAYVVAEQSGSASERVTVLCGEQQAPETIGRLELQPLEAETALALIQRHQIARLDVTWLRETPEVLTDAQHWAAVDHLLAQGGEAALAGLRPDEVERRMRGESDPSREYLELLQVRRGIESRRRDIAFDELHPRTRLRILRPVSSRQAVIAFVHHLCAHVDAAHLERLWRHAPDVFFARLPGLSGARRDYFARWLAGASRKLHGPGAGGG
jgi:hypothetical protein